MWGARSNFCNALGHVDLVRRNVLEGGVLHTHRRIEREVPHLLITHSLLPIGVAEIALHNRELIALGSLDNTVEAVEALSVIVLGDLLADILVADEDPALALLGLGLLLGRLKRLVPFQISLLLALALHLLLKGGAAHIRDGADNRQILGVILLLVVRLVERLELLNRLQVVSVGPVVETLVAGARLGVVRARGIVLDVLGGRVKPALRGVLAIQRALDEDSCHLTARLVLLVVDGHLWHRCVLVRVEGALEARGGGATAGLPLLVEVAEDRVGIKRAPAFEHRVDLARDHAPRIVRNLLELVEELDVQGGRHLCVGPCSLSLSLWYQ